MSVTTATKAPRRTHSGLNGTDPALRRDTDEAPIEASRESPAAPLFLRLYWMILAYPLLAALLAVAATGGGPFSPASLGFWAAVGSVVAARHVDVTRYHGLTGVGDRPATRRDVKRFGVGLTAIALIAWVLALAV